MKKYLLRHSIQLALLMGLAMGLLSCNGNKRQIEKEILLLQSKSINIPQEGLVKIRGKDTLDFVRSEDELFKLIVYYDSTSCSSCMVSKMFLWNDIIDYVDTFKGKFSLYFIFSTSKKDSKQLIFSINNSGFSYPILIDTNNEFAKLNTHLPSNKLLHTFLLDENNNVVIVGNPMQNKHIEQMMQTYVEEKLR